MSERQLGLIARWIRRRRIAWLRRAADRLEDEFFGTSVLGVAMAEASRMREQARQLERSL